LRQLAPLSPPELRNLPITVERAATKVRTARTKKEAIAAMTNAIAEVHKTIALLKADDPVYLRSGTRDGELVVETLQVADDKLQKAVGL
jgi:chaperonin cofactor prefoldin